VAAVTRTRRVRRWLSAVLPAGASLAIVIFAGVAGTPAAWAAQPPVGLGTATPFAVLAGTTVTNTGPSVISGDLGVSPGSAVTGFPPGRVINGTQHVADAVARQAQSGLTAGYLDAAGRTPATTVSKDLGGQTLAPGVYKAAAAMSLTGTVTLKGGPSAVFIFQAGSTLITASGSTVRLTGGAQACNVFWQVGSSATLGTHTTFTGSILALTSVAVQTGTTVAGRVLARNGAVTLDNNTITRPACVTASPSPSATPTATSSPTASPTATSSPTATPTASPTATSSPTASPTATSSPSPTEIIPSGAPGTGAGGVSVSGDSVLMATGAIALAGAAAAMGLAIRRRRG
jgi:Ice-binding-like